MRTTLHLPLLAFLFAIAAVINPCLAMMSLEEVSKSRAKELGMVVRANAAGPDAVRVWLEFDAAGELKSYSRVDLEMRDGGKLLVSSTLKEDPSKPGHVIVSFAADRGQLDRITLRVVTGVSRDMVGHDLRVKDFVDLAKLR
jgi:hypothetical protein